MISIADGIGLLIGIVLIAILADRLRIPYPILLVLVGIGVALLPVKHRVELQPELVLLVFLPPLIYDASLDTSARELRTQWRPILLLAVGLVVATMATVAVVDHALVPEMGWAVAFTLGAIVSPPDSVSATQIAGKLGLPRRLVTILGGEGLMNDATALTAYQVAVATVGTTFTVADVLGKFLFAVVAGVAIGIAVGWFGCRMLRFTETPVIENTMLLILPFAAYLPADKLRASGVLAVVATGLYFGRFGSGELTPAARLQQREIWNLIVFLLTGVSFLLVGLELRPILDSLVNRESGSLALEASAVVGVVIVIRLLWIAGVTVLPGGHRFVGAAERSERSWRETTVVGWAGMPRRGQPGRGSGPPSDVSPTGPGGVPDLRGHRGHLGGTGPDPSPAHPPFRPGDPGRTGSGPGCRGPPAVDGHRPVPHRGSVPDRPFPDEVVDRIRAGYQSQFAHIERRLEVIEEGAADTDASADGAGPSADGPGTSVPSASCAG